MGAALNVVLGEENGDPQDRLKIKFQVEPDEDCAMSRRLPSMDNVTSIETPGTFKVQQVKKYVLKRLRDIGVLHLDMETLEITCDDVLVGAEHSIHFVNRTMWTSRTEKMVLKYRRLA